MQQTISDKCLFNISSSGELLLNSRPISDDIFNYLIDVETNFTVPKVTSERDTLEAIIFSYLSSSMETKRLSDFMKDLDSIDKGDLKSSEAVYELAGDGIKIFAKGDNKLESIYQFVNSNFSSFTEFSLEFLKSPTVMRRELSKNVKWSQHKIASMLYLCLGGKELMTLDRHVLRQASGLPIPNFQIADKYVIGKPRNQRGKEKLIQDSPKNSNYEKIEQNVFEYLDKNKTDLFPNLSPINQQKLTPALYTCLFWTAGALSSRYALSNKSDNVLLFCDFEPGFMNKKMRDFISNLPFHHRYSQVEGGIV